MPPSQPLAGWRVLVTRPAEQSPPLVQALTAAGAIAIRYPTIAVGPPSSWAPFDAAVARIASYSWIVFSSPSAVRLAFEHAEELPDRLRLPGAPKLAAVGSETARALASYRVPVEMVPDEQRQEGLVKAFAALAPGTRVLFPQAVAGRDLLRANLEKRGVVVDVVPISKTTALPLAHGPPAFDAAVFASPSALRAFVSGLTSQVLADKVVAVIGPTTEQAARDAGVRVDVVAPTPSVSALVAALAAHRVGGEIH